MTSFGIVPADLPVVAIHDTSFDIKEVMSEKGRDALDADKISAFVRSFLASRKKPKAGKSSHEEL